MGDKSKITPEERAAQTRAREQAYALPDSEAPHYYPTETVGVEEHVRRCRAGLVSSVTVTPKR